MAITSPRAGASAFRSVPRSFENHEEWLRQIALHLNNGVPRVQLVELNAEPTEKADGMIVLADGTNWDPGSGAGFYGYQDGTWKSLLSNPRTWQLHETWDHSVTGNTANVDFTGLANAEDIMIVFEDVAKSVAGLHTLLLSDDNGSTFYTTVGDYERVGELGTVNSGSGVLLHDTDATAARSAHAIIYAANVSGAPKVINAINRDDTVHKSAQFVGSTDPITAVRCLANNGGNLTGGKIYCLTRE